MTRTARVNSDQVDDERGFLTIDGVDFPKRYLSTLGGVGVRLYGDSYSLWPEFAHSSLSRLVYELLPHFDVRLNIAQWVELACTSECLGAQSEAYTCKCRCGGAFHMAITAPPGVSVDGDGGEMLLAQYGGLIRRGARFTEKEINLGIREALRNDVLSRIGSLAVTA
jgi:hypothetical protein